MDAVIDGRPEALPAGTDGMFATADLISARKVLTVVLICDCNELTEFTVEPKLLCSVLKRDVFVASAVLKARLEALQAEICAVRF